MPQTSIICSSVLGPSCSGQVPPGMGERGGGASGSGDLIFQDGRLISGSLEALMEHLVPTVDYYPDVSAWAWWWGGYLGCRGSCSWTGREYQGRGVVGQGEGLWPPGRWKMALVVPASDRFCAGGGSGV